MPTDFDPSRINAAMRRMVMRGVIQATELVRKEAVRLVLETEKTGRIYKRGKGGRVHQASAPGEPWASDTGFAVSQIKSRYNEQELSGTVTIDTEYGLFLEMGTQTMEPRPVLRPALTNTGEAVGRIIGEAIARALATGGRRG